MLIHLKLAGLLREFYRSRPYPRKEDVEVPMGTCVQQVFDHYGIPYERVQIIIVNRQQANLETILKDNDEVWALPLVGGG